MLVLNGISTTHGKIPKLRNINITVEEGEVVTILGANGAGKSTILKTILGLIKPVEGTILFRDQRIDTLPPHSIVPMGISIVDSEAMFPRLTVESNLKMGNYFEKDQKLVQKRVDSIYEFFPVLKERAKALGGTLSGGERTMLAVARGMISEPSLMLMDEPSLGLAPILVEQTYKKIKSLNEEKKMTILLVEQNANKALSVSHRGYIIQKGEITEEGTTDELLESSVIKASYLEV